MPERNYLNFVLVVEKVQRRYRASVIDSPAGQAEVYFKFPFSKKDLEIFKLKVGQPRQGVRRIDSPEMQMAKEYGGRLFQAVFAGEVYTLFRSSYDQARLEGKGLRLQLRIKGSRLADLPWEYLYNPTLNRFLSQGTDTPVVRYLDLPESVSPLQVALPLKILVVIASPRDLPTLDVEGEWRRLNQALAEVVRQGLVQVERLAVPTLESLLTKLRGGGPYHVLHFVGHGAFDPAAQDGVLIFENEHHTSQAVNGQRLGTILHNHPSLRLAVLNACEGARASAGDPFAGVAQSLVQQGLPAVIAMQHPITDQAALTFAKEFYAALADGYPIDAALAEARVAIFVSGNDIEWGTPVLFMRSPDGKLFEVKKELPEKRIGQRAEGFLHGLNWRWAVSLVSLVILALTLILLSPGIFPPAPTPTTTQPTPAFTEIPPPTFTPSPIEPTPTATATLAPTRTVTATAVSTLTHTLTPSLTASYELTSTVTLTPAFSHTATPTPPQTPRLILPYQVRQKLTQEAALEIERNPDPAALDALFWSGAQVVSVQTREAWDYRDFYRRLHATLIENRHENLAVAEYSPSRIVLLTDNCRIYRISGRDQPYGNIQGDKWLFSLREGLWKIENLWIASAPPTEITYSFEDGTPGCWNIASEAGKPLGVRLVNSSDLAYDGIRSLALDLDLVQPPGEPRARIEHLVSLPLGEIRSLSAYVYLFSESQPASLEVRFFVETSNSSRSYSPVQLITSGAWTFLEAGKFSPSLASAQIQKLGLELTLPASSEEAAFKGIAFVDQLFIQAQP